MCFRQTRRFVRNYLGVVCANDFVASLFVIFPNITKVRVRSAFPFPAANHRFCIWQMRNAAGCSGCIGSKICRSFCWIIHSADRKAALNVGGLRSLLNRVRHFVGEQMKAPRRLRWELVASKPNVLAESERARIYVICRTGRGFVGVHAHAA